MPDLLLKVHGVVFELLEPFVQPFLQFIELFSQHPMLLGYDLSLVLLALETCVVPVLDEVPGHVPHHWPFGKQLDIMPWEFWHTSLVLVLIELLDIADVYLTNVVVVYPWIHGFLVKEFVLVSIESPIAHIQSSNESD